MADGQADTPAPGTLDDLAQFLVDNPQEDPLYEESPRAREKREAAAGTPPGDKPDDDTPAPDKADDDDTPPDKDKADDDADTPDDRTSEDKHTVTVKGEDGADETREVTTSDLIKGYMLQADYSRKTAELATRETEMATRAFTAQEAQRAQYAERIDTFSRTVQRLVGLRSTEEMTILSQTDPAAWAQELQRERLVQNALASMNTEIQAERAQSEQAATQAQQAAFSHAWGVLGKAGIDKPKLAKIFEDVRKHYGVTDDRLARVSDPALVFLMRDATAYRALKEKTAAVTKQVKEAPRLPAARQSAQPNERAMKRINDRFKGGHAKYDDLAAYYAITKT